MKCPICHQSYAEGFCGTCGTPPASLYERQEGCKHLNRYQATRDNGDVYCTLCEIHKLKTMIEQSEAK